MDGDSKGSITRAIGFMESHVFGKTASDKTHKLITAITSSVMTNLCLFCFRSKADMERSFATIAATKTGHNPKYIRASVKDQDFTDTPYVFCTPSKLCRIIIYMYKKGTLPSLSNVLIEGWDRYNPNEFAALGLLRLFRGTLTYRVTTISVSEYVELPYTSPLLTVECPQITVEYKKGTPTEVLEAVLSTLRIKEKVVFYPGRGQASQEASVVSFMQYPERTGPGSQWPDITASAVVDSMQSNRGKISKHIAELRADSINYGKVYRCITPDQFTKLQNRDPIGRRTGLDRTISYLYTVLPKGLEIVSVFPPSHKDEISAILKRLSSFNLRPDNTGAILSSGLSINAGIFLYEWEIYFYAKEKRGEQMDIPLLRYKFLGLLFAHLLDKPPTTYAPLISYEKFKGRNDLETMCNFWFSLCTSTDILAPPRKSREDGKQNVNFGLIMWCKENGFFPDKVSELFASMQKAVKDLPGREAALISASVSPIASPLASSPLSSPLQKPKFRASPLRKATRKMPGLSEINTAAIFVEAVYPKVAVTPKLDLTNTLPRKATLQKDIEITVIHSRGTKIEMYIGVLLLEDIPEPVESLENVDSFSDILSSYSHAFRDI